MNEDKIPFFSYRLNEKSDQKVQRFLMPVCGITKRYMQLQNKYLKFKQ